MNNINTIIHTITHKPSPFSSHPFSLMPIQAADSGEEKKNYNFFQVDDLLTIKPVTCQRYHSDTFGRNKFYPIHTRKF